MRMPSGLLRACHPHVQATQVHCFHSLQGVTPVRAADAAAVPTGNRGPPSLLVRLASAFLYIVPWIDILTLGREIYHFFPTSLLLYLVPGAHMIFRADQGLSVYVVNLLMV